MNPGGGTDTSYRGTVYFTSSDAQAALPANYTFTAADNGVHSFSVTLETAGTQSITANDTVTSTITGTQSGIVVNLGNVASFRVNGFTSPTTAGVSQTVTVTALYANGTTATGYTGTVHFTSSDAQAVLPADYTFTGTDAGVHSFTATLKTAGSQSITATDTVTSTIAGTQSGITVNAAAASTLTVTGFRATVTAGTAGTLTVTAKDAYGNIAAGYLGTVKFTSSDAQAVLPGNYTFTTTDSGVHTFTNGATLKTAGSQSLTATDTVTSTIAGTQSGITVNAAAASTLTVTAFPSPSTAGVSGNFTVTAKDPYGNTATSYRGTLHFTSSDSRATLPANYTFTASDNGVHTFSATLKTAGTQSITATDTAHHSITGKQTGIVVSPAAVSQFKVVGPSGPVTAGTAQNFTVTAQDACGNTVTGYSGTVQFTSTDPQAGLPANYTFSGADNGRHTFSVTLKTAGSQTVTVTDTSNGSVTGTSALVTVKAAAATHFRISAPGSVTHGVAFSFTVTALDAFGNVATGYTGTVVFSSSDTHAGLPAAYTFTAGDGGTHTFTATLNTLGMQSLTVKDRNHPSVTGTDNSIDVQ